ncbi:hypothetical protein HORIV_23820 [Vreelandella olivaria]|uniref:Alcohol dehydrogenase-like N-terminal domain-containing protein n=1 Tax=Vreelandella olivaria TaxID=390919 RepID=A0ABN5WSS2_9GAMM|nr:hypothetical protein HORIV_23820 [Halomonas olivaria]
MKAFQVKAPHDYQVAEVEAPEVASGEVLVRVAFAGICGSDMHIIHGDNAFVRFPRITGHEFAGVVEAIGEGWLTSLLGIAYVLTRSSVAAPATHAALGAPTSAVRLK